MKLPELLAPAGDLAQLEACLTAGADAVYFGVGSFHARSLGLEESRDALLPEELPAIVRRIHEADALAYLTLNTLLTDRELDAATNLARQAAAAGMDAVLVQDLGLARRLSQELPDLPLHASTQMALTAPDALRAARDFGIRRVVAPRELGRAELARYCRTATELGMETEVFVQGAICIAVSGLCGLSDAIGGRSANRGACAQPCRLDWRLEPGDPAGSRRLSARENCLASHLNFLCEIGVSSLKLEGRKRGAAYGLYVTRFWRQLLDGGTADPDLLHLAFIRGSRFTDAWLTGGRGPAALTTSNASRSGLVIGTVRSTSPRGGWLDIQKLPDSARQRPFLDIRRQDVIVVRAADFSVSAPVGRVEPQTVGWRVYGFHPDVLTRLRPGMEVSRSRSPELERELLADPLPRFHLDLRLVADPENCELQARVTRRRGEPLELRIHTAQDPARPALDPARVRAQLEKRAGLPLTVDRVAVEGDVRLSIAALNSLRRGLHASLLECLGTRKPSPRSARPASPKYPVLSDRAARVRLILHLPAHPDTAGRGLDEARLARQPDRLADVVVLRPLGVWASLLEEGRDPFAAFPQATRALSLPPVAPDALLERWLERLDGSDGDLIDEIHTAQLRGVARRHRLVARPSMNLMNSASVAAALELGYSSLALAPELGDEAARLSLMEQMAAAGARCLLPVFGPRPVMYMKHCPLGERRPGCRRCFVDGPLPRLIETDSGERRELILDTHPELDCQTVLWKETGSQPEPAQLEALLERGVRLDLELTLLGGDQVRIAAELERWADFLTAHGGS
ncbi:MAG: DUF3656 domain-containing protein [Bacillota bacterium]|nr:DUF3656 domain-containing protein [Bacillota bacterium]